LSIERDYAPRMPSLLADVEQLARLLKNVVGNAVEAMRELGPGRERRLRVRTRLEPEMTRIEIADSGPGLSDEAREAIFHPYFTTKRQGTGLGMAIAQRIASEHGGTLDAENDEGGGARLTIRLPRSDPGQEAGPVGEATADEARA
jgi:signal transduction histidine kinase